MMMQGPLPLQLQQESSNSSMTSFAGLALYADLGLTIGLCKEIADNLKAKARGWEDVEIILSLILLNISGGDCVNDIERLESDAGMRGLLLKIKTHGMNRKERRELERRWRKSTERAFPSASAIHRYLDKFHNDEQEKYRVKGKAFIPANNELLDGLVNINSIFANFIQAKNPVKTATLDQDATLSETSKDSAYYCYKKFKAYQPFNTYWHEQELLLHSEFRDGNVNAGFEQLRIFKESLSILPEGVEKVMLRSDSAGYQQDLLKYCAEGKNNRFGVIDFAIAARVTSDFKKAVFELSSDDWHIIYKQDAQGNQIKTNQEWAEVCFVPNFVAAGNSKIEYRYIAIRERMAEQLEIEGLESTQKSLPFQTAEMNNEIYKLFGIVTNRDIPGNELIQWHRERCGDSEKIHSVEKSDLAGGKFPSSKFGANAAWWQIMILSFNLNVIMKKLVLPEPFKKKRLKSLRFNIIGVAGYFIQHARGMCLKVSGGEKIFKLFKLIRENISALTHQKGFLESG